MDQVSLDLEMKCYIEIVLIWPIESAVVEVEVHPNHNAMDPIKFGYVSAMLCS